MFRIALTIFILFSVSPCLAAVECGPSGVPVGGNIGIPPTIDSANLMRVQIAWLPHDEQLRYRYQEVIDIDWQNQTHTEVDLYDGALLGISEEGIRDAELLDSTDFSSGHLDIVFCMPDPDRFRGLVFAHYGDGMSIDRGLVVPFAWRWLENGLWFSSVVNQSTSDLIVHTFNEITVQEVTDDVERATGVLPPRYLAESLVQQNLKSFTDLVFRDEAPLFDGNGVRVLGSQVIITGDEASLSVLHGVSGVYSDGANILGQGNRLTGLENHLGPISIESHGERQAAYIVDGRADFEATVADCTGGESSISARMSHVSVLEGGLVLKEFDQPGEITSDRDQIDASLSCDKRYRLESSRKVPTFVSSTRALEPRAVSVDEAVLFYDDPSEYSAQLTYYLTSVNPLENGWPTGPGYVDTALIRKIWEIDDLSSLKGQQSYTCTAGGGDEIDSVDDIVTRAFENLTDEERTELEIEGDRFVDNDGDGSICNSGEIDYGGRYVSRITLTVYPNLAAGKAGG